MERISVPDKPDALILAAGTSSRMGRFKPLVTFEGKPFIIHIIDKIDALVNTICIVTGYQGDLLKETLRRKTEDCRANLITLDNPAYLRGMFTSLKRGISALEDSTWILYHFADQPHIPPAFYSSFIAQRDTRYQWIQPVYQGRKGHPIMFSREFAETIKRHPDEADLKTISQSDPVSTFFWDCPFPEILEDFDTREDLKMYDA